MRRRRSGRGEEEEEGGGFGGGGCVNGHLSLVIGEAVGLGVGLAEVVEDVGEVGEVDGGGVVEVAGGPVWGRIGLEVVEDGGEVGEVDVAVEIGVAGEGWG